MADFCRQCTVEVLGLPAEMNEMAGRVTSEQFTQGYVGTGLCEGCTGGEFDPAGNCLGGCENPSHPMSVPHANL